MIAMQTDKYRTKEAQRLQVLSTATQQLRGSTERAEVATNEKLQQAAVATIMRPLGKTK